MYGVILWSDPDVGKAVIWCEDQGDLAYYEATEVDGAEDALFFDPGDYVEFEVDLQNDMRRAVNAQTIHAASHRMVAGAFDNAPGLGVSVRTRPVQRHSAEVVHLADHFGKNRKTGTAVNRSG